MIDARTQLIRIIGRLVTLLQSTPAGAHGNHTFSHTDASGKQRTVHYYYDGDEFYLHTNDNDGAGLDVNVEAGQ